MGLIKINNNMDIDSNKPKVMLYEKINIIIDIINNDILKNLELNVNGKALFDLSPNCFFILKHLFISFTNK